MKKHKGATKNHKKNVGLIVAMVLSVVTIAASDMADVNKKISNDSMFSNYVSDEGKEDSKAKEMEDKKDDGSDDKGKDDSKQKDMKDEKSDDFVLKSKDLSDGDELELNKEFIIKNNLKKLKLREKELKEKKFEDEFLDNTKELNSKIDELINAKLDSLSTVTDEATMAKIKDAMASLKSDMISKFTENQDKFSMFSKTAGDAVTKQQTYTAEIIQTLDKIVTVSPASKDMVEKLRTMITERIWPVKYLAEFRELTDKAFAYANEGKDPTEILKKLSERNSSDDKELNRHLSSEGLWAFPDVDQDSWYAESANEAAALGIVEGTENDDGFKDLRPEYKLNCAEGIAMINKAAKLKPDSSVSPEVDALGGNIEWAKPFLQSMANVIGVEKLKSEIAACGGIAGEMKRETFADTAIAVYEKMTGKTIDVNAVTEIGQYSDFDQMNEHQRENFAKAHDVGFITGADNGTRANFRGTAIRAEAAKMLIMLRKGLANEGVFSDNSIEFSAPSSNKIK